MQQVADWLEKLGLGRYAQRFAENDIDASVLSHLTDQSLKELGVSLGHRLKILAAIKELSPPTPATPQPSTPTEGKLQDAAERRQVTVVFSDLVGSTALAARMDPEDLREVISAYQRCVAETVKRFGGFVAKYMGDGILIYFGYPQAHEDDAERAVRAGLELVEAVGGLKSSAPLQTRVGIATGLVVVGDLIGSGAAQEQTIVGETPNIAARLQGIAEPNMVVIAESTRKLLGNLFELKDLGAKNLKGIAGPVQAFAALRPAAVESRFEALHSGGLTALVGREEELELLLRRWSKAKMGEGQVVLISGESGIGKSRLTAALLENVANEPHTPLRYFCSPQHTDSALFPIIGQMERAAGFAYDDALEAKLGKLDKVLAPTATPIEDAALFADMLSLPSDRRYPALQLEPQQRRQRTLQALVSQLDALTRQNPVLMVFEDAHWSDPTSLELIGRVIERIATLRVLLLTTFRPEFAPPWIGQPHVTALTLNRLPKCDIDAMIDGVIGSKLLPASIRQDIVERTDGIPLFVEEMTKAILEAESEPEGRRTATAIPGPALAVPASLQASLMARLDRLGPSKEVAQIGAAIGREFSHPLLSAVARKPGSELAFTLDRLIQSGLLFRQGTPPHATYLFKHALVQDAAYGTLLREPRRALHARIAETIERRFFEIAESQPELLARHCTEAGQIEKAASLWGKAGQRSLERSALVEAVEQLTRALDQIAVLPSTPALRQQQIKFQVPVATALGVMKGYAAPVTQGALERAQAFIERAEVLGEPPEDPLLLFSLLTGFWAASFNVFNGDLLCKIASKYLALAEKQGASIPLISGHSLMGRSLVYTSKFAQGRAHLDRAIAMYDAAQHLPVKRFTTDPRVVCLAVRSITFWMLGYPAAALTDADEALSGAREIGQAYTLMQVLINTASVHLWCGNYQKAQALYDELVVFAEDKDAWYHKVFGVLGQGGVGAFTGNSADAVRMLTEGITAVRSAGGANVALPINLSFLAIALVGTGDLEGAWRCMGEAIPMIEETGERWFEPEVHRIAGDVALKSQQHDALKAEKYFERALSVARQQQAKSWELRAAMSMARLWRDQGKRDEARELLAPVYDWFTEGFDTRDLKEAKALLDELAA